MDEGSLAHKGPGDGDVFGVFRLAGRGGEGEGEFLVGHGLEDPGKFFAPRPRVERRGEHHIHFPAHVVTQLIDFEEGAL